MLTWFTIKKRLGCVKLKKKNLTYREHKEAARAIILMRLAHFNPTGEYHYNRVAIRDQRRCWGSCSSKGNLNFSYKLLFLPPCLRDYIIVHELCHLKVLNHSASFWTVVASVMPDYALRMQELRLLERTVGASVSALKKHQSEHDCPRCEQEEVVLK